MLDTMVEGTRRGGPFGALVGASGYAAEVLDPEMDAGPIVDGDERGLLGSSTPNTGGSVWEQTDQQRTQQPQPSSPTVTVNLDSRNNVTVEPQASDIADEVVSELEKSLQSTIDDIRDDLRDAEDEIDRLDNALRGPR